MNQHHHVYQEVASSQSTWQKILHYFSEADFMPHGHCYLWKPGLVYTHVISDFLIGTAYVVISVTLYFLVKKINLEFNRIVLCFGVFIGACGWTHYNEIWNLWQSDYWYSGMVKVITAFASVGTGIYLIKLRHPIYTVAEAAKLSEQRRLDLEVLTEELEQRVEERTNALRESEARFRQLADSMTQLAWIAEPDGQIYWYNKRFYEYTGMTLEDLKGHGWVKVHHPEHIDSVLEFLKDAWRMPEPWELTFPIKSEQGKWRWFLTRAVPLMDSKGTIVQWFGTNTDITNQIETEEKLKASVRARDEFLSIASHELKTPLTSLSLQTQTMKRAIKRGDETVYSKERVDKLIDQNEKHVARLVMLVDDMLDIARIRTGRLSTSKEEFNICILIDEVVERMAGQFQDLGISLTVNGCQDAVGCWDKLRIEQVLANLLSNALKYGAGKPVRIKTIKLPESVRISVEDQGIGISKENQERIFNRFERAISANEVSGMGLGLFISNEIVKLHKGKIWVESELGKGSTFFIELPLSPEE